MPSIRRLLPLILLAAVLAAPSAANAMLRLSDVGIADQKADTIPLLMSALGGPQALLGWLVALVIVVADGLVWSELGAAMPGSGGTYRYLREGFGRETLGPPDGVPVHLAVHPQRPAGDRLRLHRLRELRCATSGRR